MTDEAALDPNMPPVDVEQTEKVEATKPEAVEVNEEPAPSPADDPSEAPKEDGVQKRINKVTADKWAAIRRAEEAERKLAEANNIQPQQDLNEPKLEDFDYDDAAYNRAVARYEAEQVIKAERERSQVSQVEQRQAEAQAKFNERVELQRQKTPDYAEVVGNLQLPDGVVSALIEAENGPELAYHLGQHKDVADSLFSMTDAQAHMKLGQITAQLSAKPEVKTSAAPEPIEPVSASGSLNKSYDEMTMEEIMNL